jgi:ribonuclease HI
MSTISRHGKVRSPYAAAEPVILATDASVRPERVHSSAYIVTTGHWGIEAGQFNPDRCVPQCVEAAELRAVYYGLRAVVADAPSVTIQADSLIAANWIAGWLGGEKDLPPWYSTFRKSGQPTLELLYKTVSSYADKITVEHVRGHSGVPLNEAADSLAGIGARGVSDELSRDEIVLRSESLAAAFLLAHYEQV